MRGYMLLVVGFAVLIGTSFADNVDIGDVEAFKQALSQDGFTVQEGRIGYLDLIKLCDLGVLPSAYGNNPSTKYLTYFVPAAPGHEVPELFSRITQALGMPQDTSAFLGYWSR